MKTLMRQNLNAATIQALLLFGLVSSCGKTDPQVNLKDDSLAASIDSNCKKNNCPPVSYSIVDGNGKSIDGVVQKGTVGKAIAWTIKIQLGDSSAETTSSTSVGAKAKSFGLETTTTTASTTTKTASSPTSEKDSKATVASTPDRIKIAVLDAAAWMEKQTSDNFPGVITLAGIPTESVSKNFVTIIARDFSMCLAKEAVSKDCSDPAKKFTDYDKTVKLAFSIAGAAPVAPVNPYPAPAPTPAPAPAPAPSNCKQSVISTIGSMIPFIGGLFKKC